jgi:hypothetical protein
MATQPTRPGVEIDPETEKIILVRLATLERDKETAEDADLVMKRIREKLKTRQPR